MADWVHVRVESFVVWEQDVYVNKLWNYKTFISYYLYGALLSKRMISNVPIQFIIYVSKFINANKYVCIFARPNMKFLKIFNLILWIKFRVFLVTDYSMTMIITFIKQTNKHTKKKHKHTPKLVTNFMNSMRQAFNWQSWEFTICRRRLIIIEHESTFG